MKIPYNRIHAQGGILLAARGGRIHSFCILDGKHIATWQHPDVDKVAHAVKAISETQNENDMPTPGQTTAAQESGETEPPAKRQKLEDDKDAAAAAAGAAAQERDGAHHDDEGKVKGKKKKKNKKGDSDGQGNQLARVPDRPVITHLTSTTDGRHILAVSGHDKVIWVFGHDGQGRLTQLSQRAMPKRPSAIAVAADSQIICADKFGDVYSLPLIPTPLSPSSNSRVSTPNPVPNLTTPAASALTVHSKRNLEALNNQKKHLELVRQKGGGVPKAESPDFELTLLLGHVSILTSLVLAESDSRKYILTSDRDEHIRVSRYIPQAHIIEGFCLGHKEFVSEIVIAAARREILISGGGDDELFVWDWKAGKVLSKASILSLAREIVPEQATLAVSGLCSLLYPSGSGNLTYVVATCEGIDAIFSWKLTDDNILTCPGIIQLPANPLHIAVSASDNAPPKLIIALDPGQMQVKSLHVFTLTMQGESLAVSRDSTCQDVALQAGEMDASECEIRRLFYTVENLRKQTGGGEDMEAEGAEAGTEAEALETPAPQDQE